jgi:hypothetical protein
MGSTTMYQMQRGPPSSLNTDPVILNTKPLFATRRTWHMAVRLTNIKPNMNKGGTSSILEVRCSVTSQIPLQTFGMDGNHKDVMPSTHWKGEGSTLLVNATDCVWLLRNKTTPVSAAIRNSRQICYSAGPPTGPGQPTSFCWLVSGQD